MRIDESALILHQYDISPFSEKVRVVLGIKKLAWYACSQPIILPKPELFALTGGYRRIPVLQIGADIYCDSQLIVEELERRYPQPSIFAGCGPALAAAASDWADRHLFHAAVGLLFTGDWDVDQAFIDDRAQMRGQRLDSAERQALRPVWMRQLRDHLGLIEQQLQDGREFLCGTQPSLVDASVYYNIFFIRAGKGRTAAMLQDYSQLLAWERRMVAIGRGARHEITREQAIAVARAATPLQLSAVAATLDDPAIGARVQFTFVEANGVVLDGVLAGANTRHIAIRPDAAAAGDILVHLPRNCGQLRPV